MTSHLLIHTLPYRRKKATKAVITKLIHKQRNFKRASLHICTKLFAKVKGSKISVVKNSILEQETMERKLIKRTKENAGEHRHFLSCIT